MMTGTEGYKVNIVLTEGGKVMRGVIGRIAGLGVCLLSALLVTGCSKGSPTGPDLLSRSIIRGTVLAAGGPVDDAEIIVDGSATGIYTNSDGIFEVHVEPGEHAVAAEVEGVRSRVVGVDSEEKASVVLEFEEDVDRPKEEPREEPKEEPREEPREEPPMSEEELCERYPRECEEPPKEEPEEEPCEEPEEEPEQEPEEEPEEDPREEDLL